MTLAVRVPSTRADPERAEQLATRIVRGRHPRHPREQAGQEMCGAVVVRKDRAGLRHDRTVQLRPHPVVGVVRRVYVPVAGAHCQEVADGDRPDERVGVGRQLVGEQIDEPLVDVVEAAVAEGDADERGDDALRHRVDAPGAVTSRTVVVALQNQASVPHHQRAEQLWRRREPALRGPQLRHAQTLAPRDREGRVRLRCRGRARAAAPGRDHRERDQKCSP
jgi:hypothetical protein